MNIDIDRIRKLAEAATPNRWQEGTAGQCNVVAFGGDDIVGVARVSSPRNRTYIIAAQPQTILALLAENRRLREALQELVACKDLREHSSRMDAIREHADSHAAMAEYNRRQPFAWSAARAALAQSPPEQT